MRPTAYIFSMCQCLVVPYIDPAKHVPGVKIGHALGVISFHTYNRGNFKKSSKTHKACGPNWPHPDVICSL